MKNRIIILSAICCMIFAASGITAQTVVKSRDSGKASSPTTDFFEKYWVGGSINLGYASDALSSQFSIGISPMIGYKFTEQFSAGPRIVYNYSRFKTRIGSGVEAFNLSEYGAGVFSRYKFFDVVFVHAEANYISQPGIYVNNTNNQLEVRNSWEPGLLLGLGYNGGGGEIYILYDFLRNTEGTLDVPIEIRFGFTIGY